MKIISWFGYFTAPRPGYTHEPGRLTRLVDLLTRGGTPTKKPEAERKPEPVRWGNFR